MRLRRAGENRSLISATATDQAGNTSEFSPVCDDPDGDGVTSGDQIEVELQLESKNDYDYLIFGHRHLPIDFTLKNGSRYVNLGDWITHFTYAVWDGKELQLQSIYPGNNSNIYRF
mgnify:CR=1 FL=1